MTRLLAGLGAVSLLAWLLLGLSYVRSLILRRDRMPDSWRERQWGEGRR